MKNNYKYNKIFDAFRDHLVKEYLAETPQNGQRDEQETQPSTGRKHHKTVKFSLNRSASELARRRKRFVSVAVNTEQPALRMQPAHARTATGSHYQDVHQAIRCIRQEVNSHYP